MSTFKVSSVREHGAGMDAGSLDAQRRQQIIAACCQVICAQGIADASLRTIAAELGATTGLVTRYYASKDALLLSVLHSAGTALHQAVALAGEGHSGLRQIEAMLPAILPVSKEARRAWQVWLAFLGMAPGRDEIERARQQFPDQLRYMLIRGLREAQLNRQVPTALYPPYVADMLVNQILGIAVRGLGDPARYPAEKMLSAAISLFNQLAPRN